MRRREFIAWLAGMAAAPAGAIAASAQTTKVFRIGLLETLPVERNRANYDALRRGLAELGYVENRNVQFEYRSPDGNPDRFPALAAELVRSGVDLIVTRGTPSAQAARAATDKIPIVMAAIGEPLNVGVVASLANPGGNVTGFSSFATELSGKRVELLKEALPSVSRIGFMMNMGNSSAPPQWEQTLAAARAIGLAATLFDVRQAADIPGAFAAMADQQIQGLWVGVEAVIQANAETVIRAAADRKILVVYVGREFVELGGLLSYGPSYSDLYYRSAALIDRIFKGARPGDLPVAQPVKLELAINLKTARALGLTVPATLIARADEVIGMRRREFITLLGTVAAMPLAARAQQPRQVTIGILNFENPEPYRTWLREDLREIGYAEGDNLRLEFRSAEGHRDRLAGLAAELIGLKVDVLVAYPTPAVVAAKEATREIPIVMLANGDPVGTGLVASLARPGGNVTGTSSTTAEIGPKTLEIVREIIPSLRRVTVLTNPGDPFSKPFVEQLQLGGVALRLDVDLIAINAAEELDPAFAAMTRSGVETVVVQPSLPLRRVADLALQHRLAAIAPNGAFAEFGGLAAYSASQAATARTTAAIIDRILKGSKPADVPVEQPTKFALAINLKTAKALGLDIPPTLLARADRVIE